MAEFQVKAFSGNSAGMGHYDGSFIAHEDPQEANEQTIQAWAKMVDCYKNVTFVVETEEAPAYVFTFIRAD